MNRTTESNWLQKEHASSLHDGGPLSLFHVTYVWGKLGEYAATLLKGAHVQVEGEIRTRDYTAKAGTGKKASEVKKSITEVRVISIAKLERPKKTESEPEPEGAAA